MEDAAGNVKVVCRFRPLNEQEQGKTASVCVQVLDTRSVRSDQQVFTFDHVFDLAASQEAVYEVAAKPIVEGVMTGFNGTVIAYGQTASGKTHTMTGPDLESVEMRGVIPRMVETVFEDIAKSSDKIEFSVKVAYAEVYMEEIRDLLDRKRTHLKVVEDRARGVYIKDLTEHYVASKAEVYKYMSIGLQNREVGATCMNIDSSRSHSIFILTVSQTNALDYSAKTGKLYLVDLAGSEKVGKTRVVGKRLEEAKKINQSLTTLGLVINNLTDTKAAHVPYRSSKLTRVLQDSLGGNSKTTLIVTCSPSVYNEGETLSTLRFGVRAKAIKNTPKVNREFTVAELKLLLASSKENYKRANRRIAQLERCLSAQALPVPDSCAVSVDAEDSKNIENEVILELEDTRRLLSEAVTENQRLQQVNPSLTELDYLRQQAKRQAAMLEEQEVLIEQLRSEKEVLDTENEQLRVRVMSLEQEALINSLATKQVVLPPNTSLSSPDTQFSLSTETDSVEVDTRELLAEVDRLRNELARVTDLQDVDADEIRRMIRTEEQRRWKLEKLQYTKSIERRVNKYVGTLELELKGARENYTKLELAMTENENLLCRRNQMMEEHLAEVMKMCRELSMKKATLQTRKVYYYKKCLTLKDTVRRLRDRLKQQELPTITEESTRYDTKLKITIRGGTNLLK